MKYYAPENASFLLPFNLDTKLLKQDLEKCKEYNFLENYIPENYKGKDYILPLRSIGGKVDFSIAVANQKDQYKDTVVMEKCLYFKKVVASFLCEKEAVRIMNLPPGKKINTQTDYNCGYEDGIFRIHVPIQTNEEVFFILNDVRLIMNEGEVWYANVNLPHSVTNNGTTNRVHLVIDCVRNEWSDNLFRSLGYDFSQEDKEVNPEYSKETMIEMIKALKLQDNEGAKNLIKELEAKL